MVNTENFATLLELCVDSMCVESMKNINVHLREKWMCEMAI